MSKHTPGPWALRSDEHGHYVYETTDTHFITEIFEDDATALADARLIATAPELLAALQELVEVITGYFPADDPRVSREVHAAIDVIAKATGEGS